MSLFCFTIFSIGDCINFFGGKKKNKNLDDSAGSSNDIPSSIDETETPNPTIVVTNAVAPFETMATLDDIDEDEAFISELMAMHPNDEDLVVEDLEEAGEIVNVSEIEVENVQAAEAAIEDVRHFNGALLCSFPLYRYLL